MVRRRPADKGTRRVAASGKRRTVAAKAKSSGLALDDTPLSIGLMRDKKRLLVCLPYELWTVEVDGADLRFTQSIELKAAEPSVTEGEAGALWIGGDHLHRGSAFAKKIEKVGTKLGGYVDHVALLRPGLLAGVGAQGEVLIDLDKESVVHKRKAKGTRGIDVTASADERAIFADGSSAAWIIDPAHPGGYTQLRFERRSEHNPDIEGITHVHVDARGRCLFAARDGAVGWTQASLRRAGERWCELPAAERTCLALDADAHWAYVLRPRGRLQRFLLEAPPAPEAPSNPGRGRGRPAPPEPPPPPPIQETRLPRAASCLAVIEREGAVHLVLGGPQSDGMLGRLWLEDPASLDWEDVPERSRPLREAPRERERSAPNFEQIRNKLPDESRALAKLSVDDVIGGRVGYWVVEHSGQWTERATARLDREALLPGDTLLLPAMVRTREGTVRPALLAWPGVPEDRDGEPADPMWLCWGDDPRGWMPMATPQIREQRWTRSDLFPMQVSLRALPEAPGRRARLNPRWVDKEQFDAMARECKKLLKVLW